MLSLCEGGCRRECEDAGAFADVHGCRHVGVSVCVCVLLCVSVTALFRERVSESERRESLRGLNVWVRVADFIWAVVTVFDTAAAYDVPCAADSNIWVFSMAFVIVAPIIGCCVSIISALMRRSILSCLVSLPPSLPLIPPPRHLFSLAVVV